MRKISLFTIVVFLFFTDLLISCTNKKTNVILPRLYIDESLEWASSSETSSVYDTDKLIFFPLEYMGRENLTHIAGNKGSYLWLKCNFRIPEELKYEDLGLYIPQLRFADKVWINKNFSGSYGDFPPEEHNAMLQGHYYDLPQTALFQNDVNELLIKVWVHGRCEISKGVFIGKNRDAKNLSIQQTFKNSIIYIFFEGGMFAAVIMYTIMFFHNKKRKDYLYFALFNFFTMFLHTYFFAPVYPLYQAPGISILLFTKIMFCVPICLLVYFAASFEFHYIGIKVKSEIELLRGFLLVVCLIGILTARTYAGLLNQTPFIASLLLIQLLFCYASSTVCLFIKKYRKRAREVKYGYLPFLLGFWVDFVLRIVLKDVTHTYYLLIGIQVSIIMFLVMLTLEYNRTFHENYYLNKNLQKEVEKKTIDLTEANDKLEHEIEKADNDLVMAAIVQQKFFHRPEHNYVGWDIGIVYDPLEKVSGDLFDFYGLGKFLEGFSIFDVSGHGIAASLITMLSKNIIFQAFRDGNRRNVPVSKMLEIINKNIKKSKGEIENYLTGLLFKCGEVSLDEVCKIEFANAGHPHPVLYRESDGSVQELKPVEESQQFGAIGIYDLEVSFVNQNFEMRPGDILVCFTDGISEMENKFGKQFGVQGVMKVVTQNHRRSAQEIAQAMKKAAGDHADGNMFDDDVSIIVLKRESSMDFVEELAQV